jgi:hypothetical protein
LIAQIGTEVHVGKQVERLPYLGESASDRLAYEKYLDDVKRGKSLMQLIAAKKATTPQIRSSWSARTFTAVQTTQGIFDDVICNISYHFNKHGAKYGTVAMMTQAAQRYFRQNRHQAVFSSGILRLPGGSFEPDGRIVTFFWEQRKYLCAARLRREDYRLLELWNSYNQQVARHLREIASDKANPDRDANLKCSAGGLRVVLEDPYRPDPDPRRMTNLRRLLAAGAENSMRPVAIGRRNWIHIGSEQAGPHGRHPVVVLPPA